MKKLHYLSVKKSFYQYFHIIIYLSHWFRIKAGKQFCNLYLEFTSFSQSNVLNAINTVQLNGLYLSE